MQNEACFNYAEAMPDIACNQNNKPHLAQGRKATGNTYNRTNASLTPGLHSSYMGYAVTTTKIVGAGLAFCDGLHGFPVWSLGSSTKRNRGEEFEPGGSVDCL